MEKFRFSFTSSVWDGHLHLNSKSSCLFHFLLEAKTWEFLLDLPLFPLLHFEDAVELGNSGVG